MVGNLAELFVLIRLLDHLVRMCQQLLVRLACRHAEVHELAAGTSIELPVE